MLNGQVKLQRTTRTALTSGNGQAKTPAIPGSIVRLLLRTAYFVSAALALQVLILGSGAGSAAPPEEQICDVTADSALGFENYPAAIALHSKLLQSHPDNALAHYHLGFAYGMMGRGSEEVNEYLKAASLGLREWDLFLNLGLAYVDQHDYLKAVSALETSVSLRPEHPEAHYNLALAYEKAGRLNDAMKEISSSLRMAPADLDIRNTKAIICAEAGNLRCAHDEWVALLAIAPNYAPARTNLATLTGAAHSSYADTVQIPRLFSSESWPSHKPTAVAVQAASTFKRSPGY